MSRLRLAIRKELFLSFICFVLSALATRMDCNQRTRFHLKRAPSHPTIRQSTQFDFLIGIDWNSPKIMAFDLASGVGPGGALKNSPVRLSRITGEWIADFF